MILFSRYSKYFPPTGVTRRMKVNGIDIESNVERLQNYEDDVLRFMVDREVPFTNNQGENDLRMAKVQQKISGCFRSEYGAEMFFGLRSYLSSCKKQGVSASTALALLLKGMLANIFTSAE